MYSFTEMQINLYDGFFLAPDWFFISFMMAYYFLLSRWFFGDIKRQEGERLLMQVGNKHGAFLIRKSENRAGQGFNWFALSIRDGDQVRHYRIKTTDNGKFYVARKQEFSTLSELVDFYSHSTDGGLLVNLREPCIKVCILLIKSFQKQ